MRRWTLSKRTKRDALIVLSVLAVLVLAGLLILRSPGLDVRDGRNDRGHNGLALGASWVAGDAAHASVEIGELARAIREHHIAELYLQLPAPNADGALTGFDSARIEQLLYECYDARGWAHIGVAQLPFDDPRWRRFFIVDLRRLLDRHPRLRGVQLDLSNIADVSPALLTLLDELRPVLAPDARPLSIVARHWEQPYFREVARRADQLVVPLDVSASAFARFRVSKDTRRIGSALAWCEGKPVLFRIPADKRLRHGLSTVHFGLSKCGDPARCDGIILEATTAPAAASWTDLRIHFLRP